MQVMRRAARAILIDDTGRLVVFKRTVPKRKVYWSTPGGGVDAEDGSVEAALHRELFEELGATVDRAQQVFLTSPPRGDGIAIQHFFVCRLVSMNIRKRTGSEFSNPAKGRYDVERFDLRAKKPKLARVDLQPREARDFILANRAALLGAVLDDDMPPLMAPPPLPEPVVVEVEVVRTVPVLAAEPVDVGIDGSDSETHDTAQPGSSSPPERAHTTSDQKTSEQETSEQETSEQEWSDADDAAARDDREALVPVGVGGRQASDATNAQAVAPTPLGAGLRAAAPAQVVLENLATEATVSSDDDEPEAAAQDDARRPWYRRMFGRS